MCNIRTAGKVTTALLVAIAVSAFAETSVGQTNVIDPAARQEIDHVISSYVDALNNWNSQTAASLILPQGLVVEPAGVWRNDGKQIKESIDILQKLGVKFTTRADDIQTIFDGRGVLVTVPYTAAFTKAKLPSNDGTFLFVLDRTGENWKVAALAAAMRAPAPSQK